MGVTLGVLFLPFVAALIYFPNIGRFEWAPLVYAVTKGVMMIAPVILFFCIGWPRVNARKYPAMSWVFGLLIGIVSLFLIVGPGQMLFAESLQAARPILKTRLQGFGMEGHFLWVAIFISVFHSALEEYYWRWCSVGMLSHWMSHGWLDVLCAIAFSLHHFVITVTYLGWGFGILAGCCVMLGGLVWSVLYRKTGVIGGAWLAHVGADIGIMYVGWQLIA